MSRIRQYSHVRRCARTDISGDGTSLNVWWYLGPGAVSSASSRSPGGADRLQCPAPIAVILYVDDFAIPQPKDLEQLSCPRSIRNPPLQADDYTGVRGGDHLCSGIEDLGLGDALRSVLEDRPGLVRAVSARRVPPPQVSARHASPFEVLIKQHSKGLDVSGNGSVEGGLEALCVSPHRAPRCGTRAGGV